MEKNLDGDFLTISLICFREKNTVYGFWEKNRQEY